MCCIIFSELKKLNAKFFGKVRIVIQSIFSRKVWFQVLISQRIFYENVISAQKLSIKFGSVFNFHARFFGNNFNKFLSEKQERSFRRKFGKYVAHNVSRLKNVAKTQHQANTNIHKTLNWATAPFQKFPKLAIFLNRCCVLHNIFWT